MSNNTRDLRVSNKSSHLWGYPAQSKPFPSSCLHRNAIPYLPAATKPNCRCLRGHNILCLAKITVHKQESFIFYISHSLVLLASYIPWYWPLIGKCYYQWQPSAVWMLTQSAPTSPSKTPLWGRNMRGSCQDLKSAQGMMTSSHGNAVYVTGSVWGESTSHKWIPLTKGQ